MNALQQLMNRSDRIVAGLMSGTSLDGVDVALMQISRSDRIAIETLAFTSIPYPEEVRDMLLRNSANETAKLEEISRMNIDLARIYASAVLQSCHNASISPSSVDLIGSHGQTICHLPADGMSSTVTFQIGDPSTLANLTGIPVVGDFRMADVALGGQGAPLVPYFDYLMFRDVNRTRIALNIGGIANVTVMLPDCAAEDIVAFDTGPGNMVMDILAQRLLGRPYDNGGAVAALGTPHTKTLNDLLDDPFFSKLPPKSTGRESFGRAFVDSLQATLDSRGVQSVEDVMATASALTVESIFRACNSAVGSRSIDDLIVAGGGARNDNLMSGLQDAFTTAKVTTTEALGIDPDAKEAICFGVLANETIDGYASNVPSATGAQRPTVLGKICLPPPDRI